jgi:Flp pilus assembly protein TadG
MARPTLRPRRKQRRGVIIVLAALLLVFLLGMIAFAVDVGYITLVRSQLQAAADSAALAAAGASSQSTSGMQQVAQTFAGYHSVAGRQVQLGTSDVQVGTWNATARAFTPVTGTGAGTAVKVTVRTDASDGGATPLFFGRIFGMSSVNQQASAVASVNPRDIVFVVDLSGSMNDDTSPGSSTSGSGLMQIVYNQFGFGTYPGATATLNTSKSTSWVMTNQIKTTMPNAIPAPNTSSSPSVSYWGSYISYVKSNWSNQLGYKSYLDFMMHYGRDIRPDGSNYTPMSLNSNLCACPLHSELVGGMSFSFPPDEMPTHAARSALIAAMQVVQTQNQNISDTNQMDWVSIVTFDTSARIQQTLTSNYATAMAACTSLQACSDSSLCTNSEAGLITAYNLIKPQSQGGQGRENTNKIVVLLTDGQPNLQQSSNTTISQYITANPRPYTNPSTGQTTSNWFTSGSYYTDMNAALMQTSIMQGGNWYLYPVGVGLNCDYTFMDNMSRMGNTANNNGQAPRGSGDPSVYQALLTQIFNAIITNPKLRLVQ